MDDPEIRGTRHTHMMQIMQMHGSHAGSEKDALVDSNGPTVGYRSLATDM